MRTHRRERSAHTCCNLAAPTLAVAMHSVSSGQDTHNVTACVCWARPAAHAQHNHRLHFVLVWDARARHVATCLACAAARPQIALANAHCDDAHTRATRMLLLPMPGCTQAATHPATTPIPANGATRRCCACTAWPPAPAAATAQNPWHDCCCRPQPPAINRACSSNAQTCVQARPTCACQTQPTGARALRCCRAGRHSTQHAQPPAAIHAHGGSTAHAPHPMHHST